ncbi:hypothetical protein BGZ47_004180, partial [Haplosporangium gracile]
MHLQLHNQAIVRHPQAIQQQRPSNSVTQGQEPRLLPQRVVQHGYGHEPVVQQQQQQQQRAVLPDAPRIPTAHSLQHVMKQWDDGEPGKGLFMPLRLWTKAMRKTDPTRYSQRKLIAKEFIFLGRSEKAMGKVHGSATGLIRSLLTSIRNKKRERRRPQTGDALEPESESESQDEEEMEERGEGREEEEEE